MSAPQQHARQALAAGGELPASAAATPADAGDGDGAEENRLERGDSKGDGQGGSRGNKVPVMSRFLLNTYNMLEDHSNDEYISWNEEGNAILLHKLHHLSELVLPKYFKHSNVSSFVRQLNMYGFTRHKVGKAAAFGHPLFLRGHPENLTLIKRKTSVPRVKVEETLAKQQEEVNDLIEQLRMTKEKTARLDDEVVQLQAKSAHLDEENAHLWEVIDEAKARHRNMVSKMKMMMSFLAYIYKEGCRRLPDVADALPQILDLAKETGVDIGPDDIVHPSALLAAPQLRSDTGNSNNDLIRMPSIKMLPSTQIRALEDDSGARHGALSSDKGSVSPPPADNLAGSRTIDGNHTTFSSPLPPVSAGKGVDGQGVNSNLLPPRAAPVPAGTTSVAKSVPAGRPTAAPAGQKADDADHQKAEQNADDADNQNMAEWPIPPADPLERGASLQSFIDIMSSEEGPGTKHFGEYNDLARGVSQLISDQDNTLMKLNSLCSTLSEPFDAFALDNWDPNAANGGEEGASSQGHSKQQQQQQQLETDKPLEASAHALSQLANTGDSNELDRIDTLGSLTALTPTKRSSELGEEGFHFDKRRRTASP